MNANEHESCYGNLLPDTLHVSNDRTNKGRSCVWIARNRGELP